MYSKSLIIEMLKQKQVLSTLEQDILDTYDELSKRPFDRDSAIRQSQKNNINYPNIFVEISTNPTIILKPWAIASNDDVYSNLMCQLGALAARELEVLQRVQ